jgi:hypothetical protein
MCNPLVDLNDTYKKKQGAGTNSVSFAATVFATVFGFAAGASQAQVTPQELQQLGSTLTP